MYLQKVQKATLTQCDEDQNVMEVNLLLNK